MKRITKLLTLAITAASMTAAHAEVLTFVSYGGSYGAAQKRHMVDPYVAQSGNEILSEDFTGGLAEIKAQVNAGNILWDVIDIELLYLERACSEGLLEVIPHDMLPAGDDGTPAADDFISGALSSECGVGAITWSVIFAYDESKDGPRPTALADFFDTDKFPGKRAMMKRPEVSLEWALLADGVAPGDVYRMLATPEGQDRAFAKLDSIRDEIIWFESWSQAPQILNDGGVAMVQSPNGRIYAAIQDEGKPFKIVWDGHVYDLDVLAIVAGTEKKEVAFDFIKFATGSKPLAGIADVAYGPLRKSSVQYLDPAVIPHLPTAHFDEGLQADGFFWADYSESLSERFNEWLLK